MPKVQGQKPALEETRNSKVTVHFSFAFIAKKSFTTLKLFLKPLFEGTIAK
jgi:hypothetical protein